MMLAYCSFIAYLCRMKRFYWTTGLYLAVCLLLPGCRKQEPEELRLMDPETRAERRYVNMFAWNVMDAYYLWRDEVAPQMEKWENWEEPMAKVKAIRYKDAKGEDIDRWTVLTDDFASFEGGVSGHTRTLGMDFQLYYADKDKTRICAVVTFTYAGSPAAEAGLGRGDAILSVDGEEMTPGNYQRLVRQGLLGGGTVKLGLDGGRSVTLTAIDMYEDPVHTACILEDAGGRKVGYLHYTSFTLDSCDRLTDVFREFVEAGIGELVLDLRYNSGGYIITETVLASMLAPLKEVEAGSVFSREIYNAQLSKEMDGKSTCFETGFMFHNGGVMQIVTTKGANPDLPRLYVLVTGASASASECLIGGLRPYMDVILVGERTYGKYCAGFLMDAPAWFDSMKDSLEKGEYDKALPYVGNWGIYLMYSRYADCNGVTLSMPDGIAPDVEVADNPADGYPLGDPRETMLAAALARIEGRTRSAGLPAAPSRVPVPGEFHPRTTGLLVGNPPLRAE